MAKQAEGQKRDFIKQLIVLVEENSETLLAAGFDPVNKIATLKSESEAAELAEVKQQEAFAAYKNATRLKLANTLYHTIMPPRNNTMVAL